MQLVVMDEKNLRWLKYVMALLSLDSRLPQDTLRRDIVQTQAMRQQAMLSRVQKWGNSQGIRIPKNLLEHSRIKIGEDVDITVQEGKIIIEPIQAPALRQFGQFRGQIDISKDFDDALPEAFWSGDAA